jgi:long-chain acyl-CoA synthetase
MKTCIEFYLLDLACIQSSVSRVGLYDTLGADSTPFIINQTEMTTLLIDNACGAKLMKCVEDKLVPKLKNVIFVEDADEEVSA